MLIGDELEIEIEAEGLVEQWVGGAGHSYSRTPLGCRVPPTHRRARTRMRATEREEGNRATQRTSKVLLAAAIAGLLAIGALGGTAQAADEKGETGKCYGANKCKGEGACSGQGHSCAGKNACKGQGSVETDSKDACLNLEGGRLTPEKS